MKKQNKTVTVDEAKAKIVGKQRKGFAAMTPEEVVRIARMGGKAISKDRNHMRNIGRIGGATRLGSQSTKNMKGE
jgi:general stress protein YciG